VDSNKIQVKMQTSYQYFKGLGCKEIAYENLPKDYVWITGDGGDGWYWNFFMHKDDLRPPHTDANNSKAIMCKIKKL
jgi:hypothetical protein